MTHRIVLATVGSLGDVHPFIALGQSLKARGFDVVLATPKNNLDKATRAGLKAEAIFPTFEEMGATLGMTETEATDRMLRDPDFLIRRLIIHYLPESTRALDRISEGASAIVYSMFALAGPIVAEARGLPSFPVILQPMTMMSPHDPPATRDYWFMKSPPRTARDVAWNRAFTRLVGAELRRRYARPIDKVRAAYGLAPSTMPPVFPGPPADAHRVLALYPEAFGARQPDFPPNVVLAGFPLFDSHSGAEEELDDEAETFLSSGEPPLVFTLGSFAVYAPGDFYRESLAAAQKLGRRAVLLTGPAMVEPHKDVLVRAYLPHSRVFPHAAVVVHHGGIGTTGAALRAGKVHLVVPHMGDQPDHAARIERMGVGQTLRPGRYTASRAAAALEALLNNRTMQDRATALAPIMNRNGAEAAAEAIGLALV